MQTIFLRLLLGIAIPKTSFPRKIAVFQGLVHKVINSTNNSAIKMLVFTDT